MHSGVDVPTTRLHLRQQTDRAVSGDAAEHVSLLELSEVLREFARTMVTDFPIQGILDHLVKRIVEILPMTGAGVTLITPDLVPRYVAASNESALVSKGSRASSARGHA